MSVLRPASELAQAIGRAGLCLGRSQQHLAPYVAIALVFLASGALAIRCIERRAGDDDPLFLAAMAVLTIYVLNEDIQIDNVHQRNARKADREQREWERDA